MKWIFTILVALNLIVFGSMVAQKMLLKNITAGDENTRTIVIQTPPAPSPPPAEADKKPEKPKTTSKPKTASTQNTQTRALPPVEPRRCGGASVTLKENDYHRIKGLLAQWPNAASRSVERNPNAGTIKTDSDFWVIAPAQNDGSEQMMNLMAKGFRPSQENGLLVLGKFSSRPGADALRQKAIAAGVNANVMEKIREGGQALSVATYNVAFLNINDADARKLSEILKPYAPLRRNPCTK